jgi:very-short-patch-repair endonuclease
MQKLLAAAAEYGGLIPTYRIRELGISAHLIRELCRDSVLIRIRRGWYALPGLPTDLLRAARVGGQLTCHSVLRDRGVWVMPDARLHVAVDAHAVRLRDPDDSSRRLDRRSGAVVVHWRRSAHDMSSPMATVEQAISDLESCADAESFAVALDSALHQGLLPRSSAVAHRYANRGLDGVCESGIETLFWMRLKPFRRSIRRQVVIPGVGRVDFLIGARVVVEVDGREHHTSVAAFERDRRRDAKLAERGFRVLRFSYAQVMHDWPTVERTIRAVISRREHHARRGAPGAARV